MTLQQVGKYRIGGRIGRGGMGSVYRAHDPVLDRPVALKVISAAADVSDDLRARFFLEAQACARLTHQNIVTIYDMGEADGHLFIVMELLEGDELRDLIARRAVLAVPDRLALMLQVCDGLHYAHQRGIVHRDVKPGNIFVQPSGLVKILDFGIARIEAAGMPVTRTGDLIGTLQYMAPERVRGRGDQRADIFSVGAVLYEVLTHRAAFEGDDPLEILERLRSHDPPPPSALAPGLPPELDTLVARALDKDPARRFASLDDVRTALQAIQQRLAPPEDVAADAVRSPSSTSRAPFPAPAVVRATAVAPVAADPAGAPSRPAPARNAPPGRPATGAPAIPVPRRRARPSPSVPVAERVAAFVRPAAAAAHATGDAARGAADAAVHAAAGAVHVAAGAVRRAVRALPHPGRRPRLTALAVLTLAVVAVTVVAWWPGPPPPDTQLEDLRRQVAEARTGAVETDAATLSSPTFTDAEHASAEAEQRLDARDRAGALVALRRAEAGYRRAEREAAARRLRRVEADATPQAIPAATAPQPAAIASVPPPPAAPRPAAPVPAPAPADAGAPVRAALADYARAIETKDLILLRRVRPGLDDDDLRRWARSFEITQSRKVSLRVQHLEVGADRAEASGRREDVVLFTSGQRLRTETRFVCTLVRGPQGWTIQDLRETRDPGSPREGR